MERSLKGSSLLRKWFSKRTGGFMKAWCFDIETNGFLDESTVDYTASPWRVKETFELHCIVATTLDKQETVEFVGEACKTEFLPWMLENVSKVVGHNIIGFDLMVLNAVLGIPYTLGFEGVSSTWGGKAVEIVDTYVLSKTLWPDRPAHSVEYFGHMLGVHKIDWRNKAIELGLCPKDSPKGSEFIRYHPEMLVYCKQDVLTNIRLYEFLQKEAEGWGWDSAIELEHYVAWCIARQSHRGFFFHTEKAEASLAYLDKRMQELRQEVEPHLPEKPLTKTKLKDYTPPALQFKKDGTPSANMFKWAEKHKGFLECVDNVWRFVSECQNLPLPLTAPLKTHEKSSITDSTFIKELLVSFGWQPTNVKEKDLTLDTRKVKLPKEKYDAAVERYVEQTLASPFCGFRLERLKTSRSKLKDKLLSHDMTKPLKVLTNPTFTVGQEKEIDPALSKLEGKFPYVRSIVEYLTLNHRRNSILGGGYSLDDEEEAETGFLPSVREDGRIPTPADTCGAATGRMKHRLVCNIPRVTSLYGEPIRELFGVGDGKEYIQFAYDFASLEAMIESHYCWRWDKSEGKDYCNSLVQEKPHDVHCYDEDTEILTPQGWKTFGDISTNDMVAQWDNGVISFVNPSEVVWQNYEGDMIHFKSKTVDLLVTPNHRQLYKRSPKSLNWQVESAGVLSSRSQVCVTAKGVLDGDYPLEENFAKLCVATQADGSYAKDCTAICFTFTKQRKVLRLKAIFEAFDVPYHVKTYTRKGRAEYNIRLPSGPLAIAVREELGEAKRLPWDWVSAPLKIKTMVLEELRWWDGDSSKDSLVLDQTDRENVEVVCAIATTAGKAAYIYEFPRETTFGTTKVYRAYVAAKGTYKSLDKSIANVVNYKGKIGCVAVPSTFVVVRRNGKILVSGNTVTAKKISELLGKEFKRGDAKSVKYALNWRM